jgi:ribosomal-protein-alanine N-acetyltransferase
MRATADSISGLRPVNPGESMAFSLVRCGADGSPLIPIAAVPEAITATYPANADLYRRAGFIPPWVSYVAVADGRAVGGGAFVGPPRENRVEIAYFTLEELQGLGYATRTATELVAIARSADPGIRICAFTLRESNASTRILQRLGLKVFGEARDSDAGDVWEWRT